MKKIAATGISGFLELTCWRRSANITYTVENIQRELRQSPEDLRQYLATEQPAAIVHLAGIVDVRRCREHPLEAFQSHVMETANVLEAVRIAAPEIPFIYIATDRVSASRNRAA